MLRKFREWFSMQMAKHPQQMIILIIAVVNICFFIVAAVIIRALAPSGAESMGFWAALYYTITMILDAGCIESVVQDIGTAGVMLVIVCLIVVIIGTITFTGAVIGTFTNTLSGFIEKSNSGSRKLYISDHLVILNWNSRASEIINDLLYCDGRQRVVVLTDSRREEIEKEINDRLAGTIAKENDDLRRRLSGLGTIRRTLRYLRERQRSNVYVVVREGDVYSSKQLRDICLEHARSVVILGSDINNSVCQFAMREKRDEFTRGNAQTIKALMQVSDITGSDESDDDQKIIVEISEDWTAELVDRIVKNKKLQQDNEKNNIVPVRVNRILGQILSQFSLMPELNLAYSDLFSNKGATFFVREWKPARRDPLLARAEEMLTERERTLPEEARRERIMHRADLLYIDDYLNKHRHAIPLGSMELEETDGRTGKKELKHYFYFVANSEADIRRADTVSKGSIAVSINRNYWIDKKRVIILGHNAGCEDIMKGFAAFCGEWDPDGSRKILEIVVIDDKEHLDRVNRYKDYPFVTGTREATIFDKDIICDTIDWFMDFGEDEERGDVSVLILSDDNAPNESIDANALANLVYVQDIIADKKKADPQFDTESIDIIVELINPKHHDIVSNYSISRYLGDETRSKQPEYSINNVVISNRYISKMVTQIGEKEAIFDFYTDILTYDQPGTEVYESKEVYAKKVSAFFNEIPPACTSGQLIRAVWDATKDWHPTVVLGYVKPGNIVRLFSGDQDEETVELRPEDKLIVFTDH